MHYAFCTPVKAVFVPNSALVFLMLLVLLNKLACELNEHMASFVQSLMVSRSSFVNAMHFLQCHSESFRQVQRGSVSLKKSMKRA